MAHHATTPQPRSPIAALIAAAALAATFALAASCAADDEPRITMPTAAQAAAPTSAPVPPTAVPPPSAKPATTPPTTSPATPTPSPTKPRWRVPPKPPGANEPTVTGMRLSAEYIFDDLGDYMYLTGDTALFRQLCPPSVEVCAGYIESAEQFHKNGKHLVVGSMEFTDVVAAESTIPDLYYYEAVGYLAPSEVVDATEKRSTDPRSVTFLLKMNLSFHSDRWLVEAIRYERLGIHK